MKIYSFLFLFLLSVSSISQDQQVLDSLILQLETATDTLRYQTLRSLTKEYSKSDLDLSMSFAVQTLSHAKDMDYEEGIITATNLVGNCYTRQGEYEIAIEKYIESSEFAIQAKDTFLISQAYNNIGAIHLYIENYEKSIEYFKKALTLKKLVASPITIAYNTSNVGEAFRRNEQLDSAEVYFMRAYTVFKDADDTRGLATTLNNIGNIYAIQENYETAIQYYEESLIYKREMNKPRDFAVACNNLGEMYFELKNYSRSLEYYKTSEQHALKSESLIEIKTAYKGLSKVLEVNGKWKESLAYFKKYNQLSDSLLNIEKASSIADFEEKYQSIEKEKEIVKLEAEKEKEHLYGIQKDLEFDKIEKEKDLETKANEFKSVIIISSIVVLLLLVIVVFIIAKRNNEKKKDNKILTTKNHEIEQKSREILDSINYAKRIQNAILPPSAKVDKYLPNSFILYKPKDIVAGDFYWLEYKNETVLFAAADCTGHGVPGAMVSVVCNNGLNRSVREHGLTDPGKILDRTREIIIEEFEKSEDEVNDGMDIALCTIKENVLKYAGANNPLWIVRNGKILEKKANKQPIGKFYDPKPYTTHEFKLQKEDTVYIFSDGYVDQFGGEKGKKFKAKALKELLLSIQHEPMKKQSLILDSTFETWKGDLEQIDDVCVIGVRV